MRSDAWRDHAECRKLPEKRRASVFFSDPVSNRFENLDLAKAICGRCPVSDDCVDELIFTGSEDGVWGGMTARAAKDMQRWYNKLLADPYEQFESVVEDLGWLMVEEEVHGQYQAPLHTV